MLPPNPLPRFRALALDEVCRIQEFMRLLMKRRNGVAWTAEDRIALRRYLRRAARTLPVLGLFTLPLGSFLLPLLAFILDRRQKSRTAQSREVNEKEQA